MRDRHVPGSIESEHFAMRNRISYLLIALALLAYPAGIIRAQEATPTIPSAFANLPQLNASYTPDGFSKIGDIPAGPTVVTVTADFAGSDANSVALLKVDDAVQAWLDSNGPATPTDAPPEWFYSATIIGIGVSSGINQSVAVLTPGTWLFLTYPDTSTTSAPFTVTEGEASTPEISSSVDLIAGDYNFGALSGKTLAAGPQIWSFSNQGTEPHEFAIMKSPKKVTTAEWMALLMADMTGTPAANPALTEEDMESVQLVAGMPALSPGVETWAQIDLEPGDYVMMCYLVTASGEFHPMLGMLAAFTVE